MQEAVSVINLLRSRALNSRLFSNLCKDMGSDYDKLILHAEVRWLSRGKVLKRMMQLKDEICIFLIDKGSDFQNFFS